LHFDPRRNTGWHDIPEAQQKEVTQVARKKQDSRFIDSVPEVVEQTQAFKAKTLNNQAIPFPWPPYVPEPGALDRCIAQLQSVYEAGDKEHRTGGKLGRARKTLKGYFCQLARYVALTLEGRHSTTEWPGFDLGRTPGEGRDRGPYRQMPSVVNRDYHD
jgi:hypothetical protein